MEEEKYRQYRLLIWASKNKMKISLAAILTIFILLSLAFNNMRNLDAERDSAVSFEKMVDFLQSGKYFEAIEIAENLQNNKVKSEYENLSGLILAQLLIFNEQEGEAEDILFKITKTKDELKLNEVAAARLARLYISQNKFDKAREIARTYISTENVFKEVFADLESLNGDEELAKQLYRELILQARESGQSTELFTIKKDNIHRLKTLK